MNPWLSGIFSGIRSRMVDQTSSETTEAPSGTYPLVMPLARVTMSGRALSCSIPNMVPVRPKPQTTSSAMNRMP